MLKGLERHKCNVNIKNFYLNFVNSPHLDCLGTILQIPTACTGCTGTDTKNSGTTRYQCDKRRYSTTQRPCTVLCRTLRTLTVRARPVCDIKSCGDTLHLAREEREVCEVGGHKVGYISGNNITHQTLKPVKLVLCKCLSTEAHRIVGLRTSPDERF
jgi:hypothetical protein